MLTPPYYLLKSRRFLPIFIVQFLGAFNDNLYKNSFIILITFTLTHEAKMPLALGLGIFILPFFLFSAMAGELADRFDKSRMIRWIKFAEIVILGLGATTAFYLQLTPLLYLVLFLMGAHASFFGPLKYSILPQQLRKDELLFGNAWVEASTFVAILLGTILGGLLILVEGGVAIVSVFLVSIALVGWATSFFILPAKSENSQLKVHLNFLNATFNILKHVRRRPYLFRVVVGISWFWFIGGTLLTVIPLFAKEILFGDQHTVTLLLTVSIIGIGTGAIWSYRLLKGQLSAKFVPLSALGMSIFMVLIIISGQNLTERTGRLADFLSLPGFSILASIMGMGVCGGFFSVPLYALLQHWSKPEHRSRNIGANNITNALFMVGSSLMAMLVFKLGGGVYALLIMTALLNVCMAIYMCWIIPKVVFVSLMKGLIRFLLILFYRVELEGMENLRQMSGRAIVIANHVSLLDVALLWVFLPGRFVYPIDLKTSKLWWMRPFLLFEKTIRLDPRHPFALKELVKLVENGQRIVIFPEGRITVTGSVMKVYEGPGYVALKTGAELFPVFIQGAKDSLFSYLKGKRNLRWFPKIRVRVFPPQKIDIDKSSNRARKRVSMQIYEWILDMQIQMSKTDLSLFESLLLAGKRNGMGTKIVGEVDKKVVNYRNLIARSLVLGKILTENTQESEAIALMIPNSTAAILAFYGVQSRHRVAAMINYSDGPVNILAACQTAKVKYLWTSSQFVKLAQLTDAVQLLRENGVEVKFLESYKRAKRRYSALYVLAMLFPRFLYKKGTKDNDVAKMSSTILFTSGSSGKPKGVVLSHKNILYNCMQVHTVVDLSMQDRILTIMPVFHAFGLTAGIVGPILMGTKLVTYPTPLHYKVIPEIIYQEGITIMFATNTFLIGYSKYANPYDFRSVRYLFGGAEKIQECTRSIYAEKFGVRALEGYGMTEASPVICLNTPIYNKAGSVGKFLPGIEYKLKELVDIEVGKELWVKGNNITLGYMLQSQPGEIEPIKDGWLNTGDIVTIDADGFVTIIGRAKRFAKIGGEMVSLDAIEEIAKSLWPEHTHACISKPDFQKGESLILVTEKKDADLDEFRNFAKKSAINPLFIPKIIEPIPEIPLLGSGKPNYVKLTKEIISN